QRMHWKKQIATSKNLLDRIVVLLLAIADLAERAADAPEARRRLALAFIRHTETVAVGFIRASLQGSPTTQAAPAFASASDDGPRSTPEDAITLALSLRALAFVLRSMTGRMRRLSRLLTGEPGQTMGDGMLRHRRHQATRRFPDTPFPPARRLDTS
ncbi:MAG: hypothetical protein Q8Q62_04040, partial [Mesorhizobium sp.]|nr:hypothetical protein [Mesorhizobium sp.]